MIFIEFPIAHERLVALLCAGQAWRQRRNACEPSLGAFRVILASCMGPRLLRMAGADSAEMDAVRTAGENGAGTLGAVGHLA